MIESDKKTVLIAEDETSILMLLERILQREGFHVIRAENGKIALDKYLANPCDVVVSDFNMPEMQGDEFIDALHKAGHNPVFIIATANSDIGTAVEMMKKGAFDYILKPFNDKEIIARVNKAFETAELRHMKDALEKEHEIRVQKQISWNAWKESVASRDKDKLDKALFYNLRTTLSQGAGFGGLVSMIYYIAEQVQAVDGKYYVDKELMDLIKINADVAKQVLDTFNEIDLILNKEIKTEKISVQEIYDLLKELEKDVSEKLKFKNHRLQISNPGANFSSSFIQGEKNYIKRVFKELLINAMEFSVEDSPIIVILTLTSNELSISFINKPAPLMDGVIGIPPEYERMVFEPFFRLVKTVDERYETLDFGLGLTFVDKVIRNFHGSINVGNIIYHDIQVDTSQMNKKDERVCFVTELPLVQ